MSSRVRHRLGLATDADMLMAALATLGACVASGGLVYVAALRKVVRIARTAPCLPAATACLLVFGKHAPKGRIDADFAARLDRAASLLREPQHREVLLLGGGQDGELSEAEVAQRALRERGIGDGVMLRLESTSRDTMQNLRHARELLRTLGVEGPVTLLSSRYHLARCAVFARQLGIDAELCAAEARLPRGWRSWKQLAGEAAYVCMTEVGTGWARLIRSQRILARVT